MLNLTEKQIKRAWFNILNESLNLIITDHEQVKDMKASTFARLRHSYTTFDRVLDKKFGLGASTKYPYLYRLFQTILTERVYEFYCAVQEKGDKPIQYAREDSKDMVDFDKVIDRVETQLGYFPEEGDLPVNNEVVMEVLRIENVDMVALVASSEVLNKKEVPSVKKRVAPKVDPLARPKKKTIKLY